MESASTSGERLPGIDQLQARSLEVRDIARCERQAVGGGDAADLQVRKLCRHLMQAKSLRAGALQKFCGGVSGRRVKGIDPRAKSADDARDSGFAARQLS